MACPFPTMMVATSEVCVASERAGFSLNPAIEPLNFDVGADSCGLIDSRLRCGS
jgi:hypothetical protein